MRLPITFILAAVLFTTAGCVPPQAHLPRRQEAPVVVEPSDEEIARVLEAVPNYDFPIEVAVCLMNYGGSFSRSDETNRQLAQDLAKISQISGVMVISPAEVEGEFTPHSIRLAAAARHADAVFMCWCERMRIKLKKVESWVPEWVPASEFIAHAVLVDTLTGSVLCERRKVVVRTPDPYSPSEVDEAALALYRATVAEVRSSLARMVAKNR